MKGRFYTGILNNPSPFLDNGFSQIYIKHTLKLKPAGIFG